MKNTSKKLVGFYHYGVLLTYISVIAGIAGICFSAGGHAGRGVICLLISGFCDAFDGAIAQTRKNRTQEDKMFGEQIDSLSDLIAFGVAPVMIGYGMGMHAWYFIAVFCIFVLCALIRLAYYNVTEELRVREGDEGKRVSYEGLPVTNVAVALPVFYLIATMFKGALIPQIVMCVCYLAVAALFVIRFRMPKLRVKGLLVTIAVLSVILISLLLIRRFAL